MGKKRHHTNSSRWGIWALSGAIILLLIGLGVGMIKMLLSDSDGKKQRTVQTVTLLKPPPPPKIKEKPPEPEVEKKQEIIEPLEEPEPEPMDDAVDNEGPMDDDLGLDADGATGSDGFGLRAKKGGRDLIGGDFSKSNLKRKYAWYTSILQEDLRKRVNQHMESNGGIPKGNHVAHVKITLDESGIITGFSVEQSSGSNQMDRALNEVLLMAHIQEPPPIGMPRTLKLKISSKG